MSRQTISFHLSSTIATERGNSNYDRAIAFHCPTLCAGTFGTDGKLGGSQLALVPITVGLGETQSYQVSVPIKLPCRAAGTKVTALNFFLSNEDGDPCDLLQDRFEAVVVVEWSI
jgi:hypothetical protein